MKYDLTYEDMTEMLDEQIRTGEKYNGKIIQVSWLHDFDESQLEEAERLNVLLPLIKWQVEHNELTEELEGELELYYEDYAEGRLDGILADYEAEKVIKDLTECYHIMFG